MAHYAKSIRIGEELAATEPDNTEWAKGLAGSYTDLSDLELSSGDVEKAGQSVRAGCNIASRLVQRNSSVVAWRAQLRGECLSIRARVALARGSIEEGSGLAAQLVQLTTAEAAKDPSPKPRIALAEALLISGQAARAAGNRAVAQQIWRKAESVWPTGVEVGPSDLSRRAIILDGSGRPSEARAIAKRLETLGYRYPGFDRERRLASW
jgi:hypothetical protein